MKFVFDLLENLKWDANENREAYTFYYYDNLRKVSRGFKFKDIKRVLNLFLLIQKEGKEIYVPLNNLTEIKQENITVWKR